jgi:hypothetical protein
MRPSPKHYVVHLEPDSAAGFGEEWPEIQAVSATPTRCRFLGLFRQGVYRFSALSIAVPVFH